MRTCLVLVITGICLTAVEGGATIMPLPGPGMQPRPTTSMARPMPGYEVETLVVGPADAEALATWASLAATGYHVVGTVPSVNGTAILYLERASSGQQIQLPSVIERDPSIANAVRAKILAERQAALTARQATPATPSFTGASPAPAPATAPPPAPPSAK